MKSVSPGTQIDNCILSALPDSELAQLLPRLEPCPLSAGQVIYEIGARIDYVYFPESGLASLVSYTQEGNSLEMAIVGYEGMIGLPAFLGTDISAYRVIMQMKGHALKMKADVFRSECERLHSLQSLMLRYAQTSITHISQTALCTRFHDIELRLCCLLLLAQDIVKSDHLHLTQESLSYMLGCRRAGITVAAGHIQSKGLIGYTRGRVTILDRDGLKSASCECYEVITRATDWLRKS
ncbi:MAG TPA: Crp/Fnr family transcriptional regulator [Blastocatellia bacterium]|jgi:CRP-like cAMP-binding protein|nr:Crp/Fnr family transcriptional regulator [Blastocatellia bacterium]